MQNIVKCQQEAIRGTNTSMSFFNNTSCISSYKNHLKMNIPLTRVNHNINSYDSPTQFNVNRFKSNFE